MVVSFCAYSCPRLQLRTKTDPKAPPKSTGEQHTHHNNSQSPRASLHRHRQTAEGFTSSRREASSKREASSRREAGASTSARKRETWDSWEHESRMRSGMHYRQDGQYHGQYREPVEGYYPHHWHWERACPPEDWYLYGENSSRGPRHFSPHHHQPSHWRSRQSPSRRRADAQGDAYGTGGVNLWAGEYP